LASVATDVHIEGAVNQRIAAGDDAALILDLDEPERGAAARRLGAQPSDRGERLGLTRVRPQDQP
jgi:hypothetical protein